MGASVSKFTHLEQCVLDTICSTWEQDQNTLRSLMHSARIIERENTGHGFYTRFQVDHAITSPIDGVRMFDGPVARMTGMGQGMTMGFILWFKDGYPDCLEGFQNCDEGGETVDLKTRDLALLTFSRLE
jgi:hypothetical protein